MIKMKIGALIPAYNAEKEIHATIKGIEKYLDDIIVIDDGSKDRTVTIARESKVTVLCHKQNQGKGAALKTGFIKALSSNWDAVITIDADGQHSPNFIPLFIESFCQNSYDIIIGSRMNNLHSMPFHRLLSNKITSYMVSKRIRQKIIDSQCGFRLIKAEVLRKISLQTSHYDTESEILLKSGLLGYRIGFIDIDTIYGNNSSSSIRIYLDTWRFVKLYCSSFFW